MKRKREGSPLVPDLLNFTKLSVKNLRKATVSKLVLCYIEIMRKILSFSYTTVSSTESYACGDSSTGVIASAITRYESLKQEESSNTEQSSILLSVV